MEHPTPLPWQIFSREWLKLFAMLFMLLDHAYMTVVADTRLAWMTLLGRLAFPLFAFLVVEGYTHTHDKTAYRRAVLVFALISELPFNLMQSGSWFYPFHQNVLFTFWIALLLIALVDKIIASAQPGLAKALLVALVCGVGVVAGTLTFVDYLGPGVLTVLVFYLASLLPGRWLPMLAQFAGLWVVNLELLGGRVLLLPGGLTFPAQGLALFSLLFIWLYNGKKLLHGRADTVFKWFSYWFYPAHILILSLVALYA